MAQLFETDKEEVMEFRLGEHIVTGVPMVEVWEDGTFIASIYGHEEGLHVVSKYLDGVQHSSDQPPCVIVQFTKAE